MSAPFGALPTGSLIIKASCDERLKRLAFGPPLEALRHAEVRERLAEILQLDDATTFAVCWNDDDGETCEIESDADLREALIYHAPSDPARLHETVTIRVVVRIDATIDFSDFSSNSSAFAAPRSTGSASLAGSFYRPPPPPSPPSFFANSEADVDEDEARSAWASTSAGSIVNKAPSTSSASDWSYVDQDREERDSSSLASWSRDGASTDYALQSGSSNDSAIDVLEATWERARNGRAQQPGPASNGLDLLSWRNALPSRSRSSSSSSGSDATEAGRSPRSNIAALDALRLQSRALAQSAGQAPHLGVTCSTCGIQPIRGPRFHCTECPEGVDLCTPCEAASQFTSAASHSASHAMLKVLTPISSVSVASALGTALMSTQQRLYAEAASAGVRRAPPAFQQSFDAAGNELRVPGEWNSANFARDTSATCDYCNGNLEDVRFLCANCPLQINNGEGYNLCQTCERHSLQCHDPAHFFLKIRIRRGQPAQLRLDAHMHDFREALLPMLYKDLVGDESASSAGSSSGASNTILNYRMARELFARGQRDAPSANAQAAGPNASPSTTLVPFGQRQLPDLPGSIRARIGHWGRQLRDEYELRQLVPAGFGSTNSPGDAAMVTKRQNLVPVESLVHPSTMCDGCYEVISGPWLRCCNCPASYDVCEACEARLGHNPRHAFAVFKQPLDLDLFRSAVDMEDNRANRPLLPFLLT
ncbi:hypothetical protein IE81DRAFT_323440 [Ceraceosorus guamensis]|uniref:ZZ-type domain-containing protein n=1 Tax=Ceraceosorus guamensis TaxID=1522189 RepID=A0A316W020_9BASI|nr:hypothetical protein IE81DRAFT_323440 [Ceraceosorus guamensis]PWN42468.1 hypothetical protein IE81DRAFT_323440 [Ceraceosorus guamensis]